MRTRNATTPKSAPPPKKTPPSKKAAAKASTPTASAAEATPELVATKAKSPETEDKSTPTPTPTPTSDMKLESGGEEAKASDEGTVVSPTTKATSATKKVTKRVVKRKILRPKTPASTKAGSAPTAKADEADEVKEEETPKSEEITVVKGVDSPNKGDAVAAVLTGVEPGVQEDLVAQKVADLGESLDKGKAKMDVEEQPVADAEVTEKTEAPASEEIAEPSEEEPSEEEPSVLNEGEKGDLVKEEAKEELQKEEVKEEEKGEKLEEEEKGEKLEEEERGGQLREEGEEETGGQLKVAAENEQEDKPDDMDEDQNDMVEEEVDQSKEDEDHDPEEMVEYGEEEGFVEPGEEDLQEDDEPETGEEPKPSVEEHQELTAAAKERKMRKELEVFVGGLDRDVVEDDVKKAFEKVGDVVEVRLLKDPLTNKNRGFAFVRFATQEQAKRVLSEMKNPVICGKRCGVAANEDNDTLFLGNICNTWTKEAIKQKLKDYGVEGVEHITLVQDPRHEGLSRGFCFIQFACHADAMSAYKRLQKPDVILGHAERTAKVAFAEPLQEPDPEVMAKVKSVFVDGIPSHWDEDCVRRHFKCYGEIERITLARNMSKAKRRDFGFVDFTTHEAATACIEDVNIRELSEGNSKIKVKARLSNPLPKSQAVKGGMCGGFLIARPGERRGPVRTGPSYRRPNFQYTRNVGPYGRRVPFRYGYQASGSGAPVRPNFVGQRHNVIDRGSGRPVPPRREPFPAEEGAYSRPFMGRYYDDPYHYDDGAHGYKRPFYMTDQDPSYMEPNRIRPRFDYSDAGRGTRFRDTFGGSSNYYSSDYHGANYGGGSYSSFQGRDRSYGGGYYY